MRRTSLLTALVFVLLGCGASSAAEAPAADSMLDGLERWIELPAHRRLVESRERPGATLAPFVTDGCSGGLSAGWTFAASHIPALAALHGEHPPWEACCFAHDRAYHAAPGADAAASYDARLAADRTMRACVLAEGVRRKPALMAEYGVSGPAVDLLYEGIAAAMYRAVRLGGVPCSPLPWRWGYGWPGCG